MASSPPLPSSLPPPSPSTPSRPPPSVPMPPPPHLVPPLPPYEHPPPSYSSSSVSTGLVIAVGAGTIVAVCVLLGEQYGPNQIQLFIIYSQQPPSSSPAWKVNNRETTGSGSKNILSSPVPPPVVAGGRYKYKDLELATNRFSELNVLGRGVFGPVHRGTLSGKEVVIKTYKCGGSLGDRDFQEVVEIISRVHHRNLVSLVGYCIHEDQKLLVYEYVPNKTLEFHLHGSCRPTLDWPRRWKIALGSAKSLAYLHEDCNPKIIHPNLKAANILLDYNFEPKVGARLSFEYVIPPEYAMLGELTDKSNVYSYGVMLLELITGRKPIGFLKNGIFLVNWLRSLLSRAVTEGIYDELVDPWLKSNYDPYDMRRLVHCAAIAVKKSEKKRPRMSQIVRYLEGEISLEDLNAGMIPEYTGKPSL
ncbi:Proline-rich receptor-like protein kinase PERK1 [Rhynchospora pubera]|uniref:non-specific serine/threonine protein kinase n=1 Tax=Rhynchospora pubera TaxID=906938 RepID=A0AAV8C2I9_9POAL|nr:Proline-rich receptor-like protein kinase PERK1 [Rhynchospora pubera]